jgi:hypothetical protein
MVGRLRGDGTEDLGCMKARLLSREVLPFLLALAMLAAAALCLDAVLHALDAERVGRYLGMAGTLLILGSFVYSLRKRKLIESGPPALLLKWHERMAWAGSLLVLVHAGIHVRAVLAWLALSAMLINVASGLTGKFLLRRSRYRLEAARQTLRDSGLSAAELEDRLYWDSLTFDIVRKWRIVHLPITRVFAVLALAHIAAEVMYGGWASEGGGSWAEFGSWDGCGSRKSQGANRQ